MGEKIKVYPGGCPGLSLYQCQWFPLSKPTVGKNIALHAVPADRTST